MEKGKKGGGGEFRAKRVDCHKMSALSRNCRSAGAREYKLLRDGRAGSPIEENPVLQERTEDLVNINAEKKGGGKKAYREGAT